MSYWPKLPPLIVRVYRDEAYIAELSKAVDAFNSELAEIVATIRTYGGDRIANQREQFRAAVAEGAAA
jgi:predicted ATPase